VWPDADRGVVDMIGLSGLLEVPAVERSVTEDNALHLKRESAWQLLLQFVPAGEAGSEHQPVERVTEAVRELGLQPVEVDRIGKAVLEGLRKATQRERRDQHNSPVSIRVWTPSVSEEDPSPSSSGAQRVAQQKRRGWGYFLLERQEGDPQATQVESHRVIELYLYQETARVK
jgi:hypothetical protein